MRYITVFLSAVVALVCVLYASGVLAEEKYKQVTIGVPFEISHAIACTNKSAAIVVVDIVAEQGTSKGMDNPTIAAFFKQGICGEIGDVKAIILNVPYHRQIEDDLILKVCTTTLKWPPKPEDNIYLITGTPIIGSTIVEKVKGDDV